VGRPGTPTSASFETNDPIGIVKLGVEDEDRLHFEFGKPPFRATGRGGRRDEGRRLDEGEFEDVGPSAEVKLGFRELMVGEAAAIGS
jgi:hypothetical protein